MIAADFDAFWQATYPETVPLSYLFRTVYPQRWLRLHSLPQAQRYPHSPADWRTLLGRHHTVLADLLRPGEQLLLVTGEYDNPHGDREWQFTADGALRGLAFVPVQPLDLRTLAVDPQVPDEHQPGDVYRPVVATLRWEPGSLDVLLREIAQDKRRAFFLSRQAACIIAPYDGGIDLILADTATRDFYKTKYQAWLSEREDGL